MQPNVLEGGFADQPLDASRAFRAVMTAMARPGVIVTISGARPPAPLSAAAGIVLLTLCDPETPIYLAPGCDTPPVRDWITFHTGAPFAKASGAMFAVGLWDEMPLSDFPLGTAEYPDRSTTVIVERPALSNTGAVLRGPGIKDQAQLSLPELERFQDNTRLFPRGLDFILTSGDRLAALPRTTRVS